MKLICVGKIKEPYLKEGISMYQKRILKYDKFECVEVNDSKFSNQKLALEEEKDSILRQIKDRDYVILFDVKGNKMDSISFSKYLEKIQLKGNVTFVIGGSFGFHKEIYQRANDRLSFSDLTFPHQLFRLLAYEQVYRAFKIKNNEMYHK